MLVFKWTRVEGWTHYPLNFELCTDMDAGIRLKKFKILKYSYKGILIMRDFVENLLVGCGLQPIIQSSILRISQVVGTSI